MDLFELIFENVDSENIKYIFEDLFLGNASIDSLPKCAVVEGDLVEKIVCLLNTEEYVFIKFDVAKFENYSLHNLSISFYKYDGRMDVNILFEQKYSSITEDFLVTFRTFSEKKAVQLKAENCFFGLEPSTDEDTQIFCFAVMPENR